MHTGLHIDAYLSAGSWRFLITLPIDSCQSWRQNSKSMTKFCSRTKSYMEIYRMERVASAYTGKLKNKWYSVPSSPLKTMWAKRRKTWWGQSRNYNRGENHQNMAQPRFFGFGPLLFFHLWPAMCFPFFGPRMSVHFFISRGTASNRSRNS